MELRDEGCGAGQEGGKAHSKDKVYLSGPARCDARHEGRNGREPYGSDGEAGAGGFEGEHSVEVRGRSDATASFGSSLPVVKREIKKMCIYQKW